MKKKRENPMPERGDGELRRLFEAAGPRPEVPAAELAALKTAAREDWRRMVAERSIGERSQGESRFGGWRTAVPLALAATVLVALSVGLFWRGLRQGVVGTAIASVERAEGARRADDSPLAVGHELALGVEILTADGGSEPVRLALRLTGGQSVRLDAGSRLRLAGESTLELLQGAVYVDSAIKGHSLEVLTPLGSVRDIGTQFEVRLRSEPTSLRVRVREGSVEVERGAESHSAVAGEELTVGSDGSLDRHALAPWDDEWDWVVAAAPGLAADQLYLESYLAWLSRETGWSVRFADEELARSAPTIEILGEGIRGLSPAESVDPALRSSALRYRLEDGVLWIQR